VTEREEYFGKAEAWAADWKAKSARSSRMAWIAAVTVAGIACFEAVALAMLMPLKSVQTVTLLVDRQTGFVEAVDPATPRRVAADEALTEAFLAQYVAAREGFDRATVLADYRKVALWSSATARASYLALMPAGNPQSPLNLYHGGSVLRVQVKSISKLGEGVALVRFDTLLQDMSGANLARSWISAVRYRYVDAPMSLEDRLINPLGFQVLSYRRDAETIEAGSSDGAQGGQVLPNAFAANAYSDDLGPQAQTPQTTIDRIGGGSGTLVQPTGSAARRVRTP
jgi:type IV secretion system protein VirB8